MKRCISILLIGVIAGFLSPFLGCARSNKKSNESAQNDAGQRNSDFFEASDDAEPNRPGETDTDRAVDGGYSDAFSSRDATSTTGTTTASNGPPPPPGPEIWPTNPDEYSDEPWDPQIEYMADPGWKDSREPLCTNVHGNISNSVWSDSRGVFVLVSEDLYTRINPHNLSTISDLPRSLLTGEECKGSECLQSSIYFNDGTGWEELYSFDINFSFQDWWLTGFDGGPLLVYGHEESITGTMSESCGLAAISAEGTEKCEPIEQVDHVFVVNESLAYAVSQGNIVRYDGEFWGPLPVLLPNEKAISVWANQTHLFVAMQGDGTILMLSDGQWELHNTRTLQDFTVIWGFNEQDVWAGTEQGGVFHYDGDDWTEIPWENDECLSERQITGMWGSQGVVYFYTRNKIARIRNSQVEILNSWGCPEQDAGPSKVTSIWGNGPQEVFFTINDSTFPGQACGSGFVVWFDGEDFHRF